MTTNKTTENFLEVWNNFKWPEIKPVTYRCYYLDDGSVNFYTMEDLPGNYIEVDQTVYVLAPMPAKVHNGKLVIIKRGTTVQKLTPSSQGTLCHKNNVAVIVNDNGTHWNYQTNELN